jgi:hypothetical protein
MNRKRQLLREFFLNALTIALMKQVIVASIADESRRRLGAANSDRRGTHPTSEIPPYFQG